MPVVLFILAMAARWTHERFLTVDEAYHWISLSRRFANAVASGNFADTFYFGHPAVTTLWLGALGHKIYEALTVLEILAEHPATFYAIMRLPPAALTALVLALAYPLMERLVGRTIALLAALLWIGEPFLVAHSQLFHMDATLTSLMTLSLLLMLVALQSSPRSFIQSPWWIASGLVAGLGMLTKSPALLLAPLAGLVIVIGQGLPSTLTIRTVVMLVWRCIPPLAVWYSMAALAWVALWPAMWVQPLATIWGVTNEIMFNGGAPHPWGNFFLGRAVADPGPFFYLVAIPFRLAPWTLIGVLLWVGFSVLDGKEAWKGTNRSLLLLAVFVVLFVAAISVMAKKFRPLCAAALSCADTSCSSRILSRIPLFERQDRRSNRFTQIFRHIASVAGYRLYAGCSSTGCQPDMVPPLLSGILQSTARWRRSCSTGIAGRMGGRFRVGGCVYRCSARWTGSSGSSVLPTCYETVRSGRGCAAPGGTTTAASRLRGHVC